MKREEEQLLHLLREDAEEGLRECILLYGGQVKTICSNILRGTYEKYVEDAVEETFISLWDEVQKGKQIKDTLQGYIYGIARKKALGMCRSNRNQKMQLSMDDGPGVEQFLTDSSADVENAFACRHNERIIHEALEEMEEPDRTIFILRYFYFYKVREIAGKIDKKEDYVESRLRRGKRKLKERLLEKGIIIN